MAYSVLVVAPHTDMPLGGAQLQDVLRNLRSGGIQTTELLGRVMLTDFTRDLTAGQFDGLFLILHGDATGWMFSDGIIDAATMTQLVRGKFRQFIFLNSCASLQPAVMLQNDAIDSYGNCPDIICTFSKLPDITAYVTAGRFASELAKHGNPRRAYHEARPGANHDYLYLAGMSRAFLATAGARV